jgi:hypothetical protein
MCVLTLVVCCRLSAAGAVLRFGSVSFPPDEPMHLPELLRPHYPEIVRYLLSSTGLSLTARCDRELSQFMSTASRTQPPFEFGTVDLCPSDVRTKQISAINYFAGKLLMLQAFRRHNGPRAERKSPAAADKLSLTGSLDPTSQIAVGLRTLSLAVNCRCLALFVGGG